MIVQTISKPPWMRGKRLTHLILQAKVTRVAKILVDGAITALKVNLMQQNKASAWTSQCNVGSGKATNEGKVIEG